MPALWSVRDRSTFAALRRSRTRSRSGPLTVIALPASEGAPSVAFAIGRDAGGAVVRNRLRRVLRDECRRLDLQPGAYLVRVAAGARELPGQDLRHHLRTAISALPERAR
ncbi:MAG TPA: ribonuclease P protein component [Acidimicrobiales bacterium]|nr:ribonuclease P protein component [Acidimicrobiales bacterium]